MLIKHILQQKSSRNIFKSMLDMHLMLWGLFETHPIGSLWSYYQLSNPPNDWSPTFSQQVHILSFLKLFLPTAWPRRKISQHVTTCVDQNFGERNSYLNCNGFHRVNQKRPFKKLHTFWLIFANLRVFDKLSKIKNFDQLVPQLLVTFWLS